MDVARVGIEAWRTEMLAGEVAAAEHELRRSYDMLDAHGERYMLDGLLAQTLLELDAPLEESERMSMRSRELAADGDVSTQAPRLLARAAPQTR